MSANARRRRESRAIVLVASAFLSALVSVLPSRAWAQACCAGSGAVTPGRLSLHEDALVGLQVRAAHVFGSFDRNAHYASAPAGSSEQDFGQDFFGSVRLPFADRAQLSLLVPFVETRRKASGVSDFGGGIGDVNFSARYDFLYAGQSRWMPGIAVLAGITFPTGTSPEEGTPPLVADATGTGAFQGNVGLALEQTFGPWLVTAYGIVAKRTSRTVQDQKLSLGAQWTALAAVAYTFPGDYAMALSASYTAEGDAQTNGRPSENSARRVPLVALSGVVPLTDHFRLQGALNVNPPLSELGKNQLATIGLSATAVYAWY